MEFILGIIILILGGVLASLGIKMFVKSEGWFYLFKALIVILLGIALVGSSFELFS